jgi:hypothetical protein
MAVVDAGACIIGGVLSGDVLAAARLITGIENQVPEALTELESIYS